jgi:hypothetical protein
MILTFYISSPEELPISVLWLYTGHLVLSKPDRNADMLPPLSTSLVSELTGHCATAIVGAWPYS